MQVNLKAPAAMARISTKFLSFPGCFPSQNAPMPANNDKFVQIVAEDPSAFRDSNGFYFNECPCIMNFAKNTHCAYRYQQLPFPVARSFFNQCFDQAAYLHILSPPGISVMSLNVKSFFSSQIDASFFPFKTVSALHEKQFLSSLLYISVRKAVF